MGRKANLLNSVLSDRKIRLICCDKQTSVTHFFFVESKRVDIFASFCLGVADDLFGSLGCKVDPGIQVENTDQKNL